MCRKYKANNRDKIAAYNKTYKAAHSEEAIVYNHQYNLDNRETIQRRQTEYQRERRKTDEIFRLQGETRKKIGPLMKGHCKENSVDLVGCNYDILMFWMKYQMVDNMTLENYGSVWHVDHVNPCANFDFNDEDDVKACYHWSNLRPMYAKENKSKNDKIDNEILHNHRIITLEFLDVMRIVKTKDREYKLKEEADNIKPKQIQTNPTKTTC
jgi:hypothetical protein